MTDNAREAFEDIASRAEYQAGMFASIEEYQKVKERVLTVRAALSPAAPVDAEALEWKAKCVSTALSEAEKYVGRRECFADSEDGLMAHVCYESMTAYVRLYLAALSAPQAAQGVEVALNPEWIADSMKYYGKILKGKFAHWCLEWDDLPIDETCPEFKVCLCYEESEVAAHKEILEKAFPNEIDIADVKNVLETFAWFNSDHEGREDIIINGKELCALLAAARLHASQPQKADVMDADSLNIERILHHVRQITRYRLCMSYNDSYFGEPEGHLKSQVAELERLLAPHKPAATKPAGEK